jgi:transposase-like protein
MARTKSAEVWALWRDRLRRFQSSGLTVTAFCDWEGVSQAAFYVWRKKLQADSGLRSRKTVEKVSSRDTSAPAFVQILPSVNRTHETGTKVVMTLADGTRVDFPASDRELIAHVVLSVATAHSAAALQGGDR